MSQKKIDPAVIQEAAATIADINTKLTNTLSSSKTTVQSLRNAWSGPTAEATINAYTAFETKYSTMYRQMLDDYRKFLDQAATEWSDTESLGGKLVASIFDTI